MDDDQDIGEEYECLSAGMRRRGDVPKWNERRDPDVAARSTSCRNSRPGGARAASRLV